MQALLIQTVLDLGRSLMRQGLVRGGRASPTKIQQFSSCAEAALTPYADCVRSPELVVKSIETHYCAEVGCP